MFLERILRAQFSEVSRRKQHKSLPQLVRELDQHEIPIRSFRAAICGDSIRLIAEIKKASPSKGLLCPNFNPKELALTYEAAGAAAISVLTEEQFFQGSLDYLALVKQSTYRCPILRKDFIIDSYQLIEARLYGADAVLLITAALDAAELERLIKETISLGMTPLVEVHDATELKTALDAGALVIGINNRNLKSFKVDLETTFKLLADIPPNVVVVAESGIKDRTDIVKFAAAGVNAVLVGETIVTNDDPWSAIKELLGEAG